MIHDNFHKLAPSGLTLNEIRSKVSGLHFGQESLSEGECQIMQMAESLLTFIDGYDEYTDRKSQG